MPFLSVVIPVYNKEKYILQLLESLSRQTFDDFEIIAVDDGSTDNSLKLMREYVSKEPRLTVIHQENKGVSGARNAGFERVKGKYVAFVDSDDWLSPDWFQGLCFVAQKTGANVVANNNIETVFYSGKVKKVWKSKLPVGCKRLTRSAINSKLGRILVWNKIFKVSFLKENEICFPADRSYCEDVYFSMRILYVVGEIYFTNQGTYYRRKVPTSMSHLFKKNHKTSLDFLLCFKRLYDFLQEKRLLYCPPFSLLKQQVRLSSHDPGVCRAVSDELKKMHIPFGLVPVKDKLFYIKYRYLK